MSLSDEEQSFTDNSEDESDNNAKGNSKRKKQNNNANSMKKVKYEDITEDKPLKKSKNALYRPPTVEELNELKETQNLYNNNLFRLQIEEILQEVKIKSKHVNIGTKWYQSFIELLDKLPELTITLSSIKKLTKKKLSDEQKIINELADAKPGAIICDQDFVLKLLKPESVDTFGLYKTQALPGPKIYININLKIPRVCFNVKDFLNNRYFLKRYYYLVYLKTCMEKICENVEFVAHEGNHLLPVLQASLKETDKVVVRVFATPTENYFRPSRFLPDINNFKNNEVINDAPTPLYNSSMAHDVTLSINQSFIESSLSELRNVQEGIKLIYIWLTQRNLLNGFGAFTENLVVYFVTYLVARKRINKHMSSYQIIRNFWNFINETDLTKNPISLCDETKTEVLDIFKNNFDVVFLDKTGCYNVASFLQAGIYYKIKAECKTAFKLLDDGGISAFQSLFITKLEPEVQYDLILTVKDNNFKNVIKSAESEDQIHFYDYPKLLTIKKISKALERGLNKRALLITPIVDEKDFIWSKDGDSRFKNISFGVNLDSTTAFNFLELGPALNDPKEKEFREFWGKLSTDRRFKDGSVCVAVYFETATIKEKREIIKTIINWVVSKKLNLKYKLCYDELEDLIINKKVTASYPMRTNEECCLKVIAASDELSKILRSLQLPLAITGVQGISSVHSFTETFPPIATTYKCGKKITSLSGNNIILNETRIGVVPRYVQPIESVLQLEQSSKWPKDLASVRFMKTGFYLEISKLLEKKHEIVSKVNPEYVDVFYEGFVFRYQLYLQREIGLLKKESTDNGAVVYKDSFESREMEKKLFILPKLVSALKGLQSQHPSYGPSTALIKRWLRSHMIDDFHFPEIAINLLNASLYLNQTAFEVSSTPQIAFIRFLKFFTELQHHIQPVLVNFNDEISKENVAEIDSKLLQNRSACPNLYIATPYDNCESVFTKIAPSQEVLRRVKQLSCETLNCITAIVREEKDIKIKELFIPNLEGYNLIIHLRQLLNPLRHEQVIGDELEGEISLQAYDAKENNKVPVTGFNPVELYLKDLRDNYGDFASFFHDSYGGNVIGVLWKPKSLEVKEFKVSNINGQKLEDGKLVVNIDGLIEDFYILGKDLVKSIDKK